jgi:hypothetical protein
MCIPALSLKSKTSRVRENSATSQSAIAAKQELEKITAARRNFKSID